MNDNNMLLANEPTRFGPSNLNELLAHCEQLTASDITTVRIITVVQKIPIAAISIFSMLIYNIMDI